MLFNSFEFVFLFLPITIGLFFCLVRLKNSNAHTLGIAWLVLASLFFYSWWNPKNLWLIIFSVVFNYCVSFALNHGKASKGSRKLLFGFGVLINLILLGYFKYFNFFADSLNHLTGSGLVIDEKVLPLAISFFTFQQIGYLVDAYKRETKNYSFLNYSLFVTFFPQLIAGPIVHHKDVLGQFSNKLFKFKGSYLAIGLAVFFAGLFKKVVFADGIAYYANAVFDTVAQGKSLTVFEAWLGALSYTLQLYFDFSGYSDMAIGAAYTLGIRLPINFNSPYKASSIVDFWRRWHITLSNFLRDYLYIPLGGNRHGEFRRNLNLMTTMLLGGLWHGAGWTFVLWGGLHGAYLVINHQWNMLLRRFKRDYKQSNVFERILGCLITFLAVVVSWVLFRADSIESAMAMLTTMFGLNGIELPLSLRGQLLFLEGHGFRFTGIIGNVPIFLGEAIEAVQGIFLLLVIVWFAPNVQEWMGCYSPVLSSDSNQTLSADNSDSETKRLAKAGSQAFRWQWRPNLMWSIIMAGVTAIAVLRLTRVSEFLYFQF